MVIIISYVNKEAEPAVVQNIDIASQMFARVGFGYGFDVSIARCCGGCGDHTPCHIHRCPLMYVCLTKTHAFIRRGIGSEVSEKWVWHKRRGL